MSETGHSNVVLTAWFVGPLALVAALVAAMTPEPHVIVATVAALIALLCGFLILPLHGASPQVARWLSSATLIVASISLVSSSFTSIAYVAAAAAEPAIVPPGLVSAPPAGTDGPLEYEGIGDATVPFERSAESAPVVLTLEFDQSEPWTKPRQPVRSPPWTSTDDEPFELRAVAADGSVTAAAQADFGASTTPARPIMLVVDAPAAVTHLEIRTGAVGWRLHVDALDDLPVLTDGATGDSRLAGRIDSSGRARLAQASSVDSCSIWHRVDETWTRSDCWADAVEFDGASALIVIDARGWSLQITGRAS